jgi:hypothetical protein
MVGDNYEEKDPEEMILCEMDDGNFIIGSECVNCYCYLKYAEICHRCPDRPDYWDPVEFEEHREFIRHLINVYSLPQ